MTSTRTVGMMVQVSSNAVLWPAVLPSSSLPLCLARYLIAKKTTIVAMRRVKNTLIHSTRLKSPSTSPATVEARCGIQNDLPELARINDSMVGQRLVKCSMARQRFAAGVLGSVLGAASVTAALREFPVEHPAEDAADHQDRQRAAEAHQVLRRQ